VRVFLSYRRGDVGGYAGRLHDDLLPYLGSKNVFQDVAAIAAGQDFTQVIDRQLDDTDAVLAILGPGWLTASTDAGERRLDDAEDYVRLELSRALRRGIPVVPVLVGRARLPAAEELPPDLAELSRRQSVILRDETWHADVQGLVRSLRGEPDVPTPRRRGGLLAGVAALAVVAVAAGGWWWSAASDDDNDNDGAQLQDSAGDGSPTPCASATGDDWTPIPLTDDATVEVAAETEQAAGVNLFEVRDARWRPLDRGSWEVILETGISVDVPPGSYHDYYLYGELVVGRMTFPMSCFASDDDFVIVDTVGTALVGYTTTCEPAGTMQLVLAEGARIDFTQETEPADC
jgi:TIR domain